MHSYIYFFRRNVMIRRRMFEGSGDSDKGREVVEILNFTVNDKIRGGGDEDMFRVHMQPAFKEVESVVIFSDDDAVRVNMRSGVIIDIDSCKSLHLSLKTEKAQTIAKKITQLCQLVSM